MKRHGIYCDGDAVSRTNATGLQVQPGWALLASRDGQHFYLCLKGGAHYDTHAATSSHRAVRATASLLSRPEVQPTPHTLYRPIAWCPSCHAPVLAALAECPDCGQPMHPAATPAVCAYCKRERCDGTRSSCYERNR